MCIFELSREKFRFVHITSVMWRKNSFNSRKFISIPLIHMKIITCVCVRVLHVYGPLNCGLTETMATATAIWFSLFGCGTSRPNARCTFLGWAWRCAQPHLSFEFGSGWPYGHSGSEHDGANEQQEVVQPHGYSPLTMMRPAKSERYNQKCCIIVLTIIGANM